MRIAIIGTGIVGRTLALGLQRVGHDVVVGTRDPDETAGREEWGGLEVPLRPLGTVAAGADLVLNANNGLAHVAALGDVGADQLAGKVILDAATPLAFSQGLPPTWSGQGTAAL